jgi:NADH:ubiquinone oxidoreductase subunit E/Pyruvate/2-oxoacid:ferredoxin oxidoreductase delta subunit
VADENPYVRSDLSKCIMCRKCITACKEIAGKDVLAIGYRGFGSKIITGFDEVLNTEECKNCGVCIECCPTGAMSRPVDYPGSQNAKIEGKSLPQNDQRDSSVLPSLKEEVSKEGCVSRKAMENIADNTSVSISDIYGVSSFYSFLPIENKADNTIRICQCVPCEMKDAKTVIGTLEKELGITPGKTTADGKFSLEVVGCIGACDQAPAMLVNDELYGDLTPEGITDILKGY